MSMQHAQRFQPVIFSDAGTSLYPLCDMAHGLLPKALVPMLNRPMIAFPLQWLVSAGFRSCIVVAPVSEHSALHDALRTLYLVPSGSGKEAEQGAAEAARVAASTSTASNVAVTYGSASSSVITGGGAGTLVDPQPAAPIMHVVLVSYGPKQGEAVRSMREPAKSVTRTRWGTAQLLYWLAATRQLTQDPLVVPVDLMAPHMPLANFLMAHLGAVPETPTLSCLLYERGAGEGTGKERERDGPATLFTAYDRKPLRQHEGVKCPLSGAKDTLLVHEPLFLMDSDDVLDKNSSDLELRMSMLWARPYVRVSTSLLDSRVYALQLAPLLPLLEAHPELNNITEQLVPFVVKCGWQKKLSKKAKWTAVAHADAPGSAELGMSVWTDADAVDGPAPFYPRAEMIMARAQPEQRRPVAPQHVADADNKARPSADDAFMARANTVPTYLDCSRYLLRLASTSMPLAAPFPLPATTGCGVVPFEPPKDDDARIHPRAQLSSDCLVGSYTRIDERATLKHAIVGRHCTIGKGVRILRSVLMDGVRVGDNAKIENCIIGLHADIGERAQLRETDVGPNYVMAPSAESKNEKLVADNASDDDDVDDDVGVGDSHVPSE